MKKTIASVGLIVSLILLSNCSVYMAAKQPSKKDVNVFAIGTPRSMVIAEVGQPINIETKNEKKTEVYSFMQGYNTGVKAGRAIFHGAADVFTFGLWEAVGTPVEGIFDGERLAYEVTFDAQDRIEKVTQLKGRD